MSFAKFDLAPQGWELGKSVLTLSALGVFTKLLHVDLSQFQVLGVSFGTKNASLIPGFIGLALMYSLSAFILARLESALFQTTNKDAKETYAHILQSKGLRALSLLVLPLSFFVYSLPYALSIFSIAFLWSDSMAVLRVVWGLATQ